MLSQRSCQAGCRKILHPRMGDRCGQALAIGAHAPPGLGDAAGRRGHM